MSRPTQPRGCVVLLSGGMDSATCLALAAKSSRPVHALTILYGQRHTREVRSARALAARYRVARHVVLRLPVGPLLDSALTRPSRALPSGKGQREPIPSTYVPARNTIFLSIALRIRRKPRARGDPYRGQRDRLLGLPGLPPAFLSAFSRVAVSGPNRVSRGGRRSA